METSPPIALTIAGFDTCGGAGLQADLLTFHNHGYHSLTASTALVVETPLQVSHCEPTTAVLLKQQLELLLATYEIAVVKIGLLTTPAQVKVLSAILAEVTYPIVLDPVGISSTGTILQKSETLTVLRKELIPLTTVITPNLPEAKRLLDSSKHRSPEETALFLSEQCGTSVLLTGGHHQTDDKVCDTLVSMGEIRSFCGSLIPSRAALHGTGCVLSSALAAHLGQGFPLKESVTGARRYLRKALRGHFRHPHSKPLLSLNHLQNRSSL